MRTDHRPPARHHGPAAPLRRAPAGHPARTRPPGHPGEHTRAARRPAPRRPPGHPPGPREPRPHAPVPRPQDWFAEQLVQVLSGRRPVHALLGHARQAAYEQLIRLAPLAPLAPHPPADAGPHDRPGPELRGVGSCRPSADVLEVFARVATGGRTRALAFRLERATGGRWQCCAVELDTPG